MTSSRRSRASAGKRDKRKASTGRPLASNPTHPSAVSLAPPPLVEGKDRCEVCRNAVSLTPSGRLRKHSDLFGHPCFNRWPPGAIPPDVDLAALALVLEAERGDADVNRRSPDGLCYECAAPIPPGRRLCGRCNARRRQ